MMAMLSWPRFDAQSFMIAMVWSLEVYRRADKLVVGYCMSLNHDDTEVMRFDLPPGKAHEHWAGLPGKPRLYYPRHWNADQTADLACSNLIEHAKVAASLLDMESPTRTELTAAAEWARPQLTSGDA